MSLVFPRTVEALSFAKRYADDLQTSNQKRPKKYSFASDTNFSFYRPNYTFFSPTSYTFNVDSQNQKGDEKKDQAVASMILGTIITIAGAIFLGSSLGSWNRTNQMLDQLDSKYKDLEEEWERNSSDLLVPYPIQIVFFSQQQMIETTRDQEKYKCVARGALVVSAFVLATGGFFASAPLMGTGAISLLASSVAISVQYGLQSSRDEAQELSGKTLLGCIEEAKKLVR